MKRQHILLPAIVISLLLLQLTFAASPRYEITDLRSLGGGYSCAYAINEAGQVVGTSATAGHTDHAFLWDRTHGMIDLGGVPGGRVGAEAYGINDFGEVVGYANSDDGSAFIWDSINAMRYLDGIGDSESEAWDINNRGQVIGTVYGYPGYDFLWKNGVVTDLGFDAHAINNPGQVVGGLAGHAALWEDGTIIDLGTLGGDRSGAYGINSTGQVVGCSQYIPGLRDYHAFLWDTDAGMIDLGPGFAYAINDAGQVIGSESSLGSTFYWDSENGIIELRELLPVDSEWSRLSASDINNRGQIVGLGITDRGEYHAFLMTPVPPKTIYVDANANGLNTGSSWDDAFNYLQDALAAAYSGDEIRVAQGIYTPDSNSANPNGSGDRTATFQLINGVILKGGYADAGTPDPNARDIQLYETILSGDLNSDDAKIVYPEYLLYDPTRRDNSNHVVTGSGTDETAVLDGFTITGGYAESPNKYGGGMYNDSGSPTVSSCIFTENWAEDNGGGMYNSQSSPVVFNCKFIGNYTDEDDDDEGGSGMCNEASSPTLINCVFSDNWASFQGGGMYNRGGSSPRLTNCMFSNNIGYYGGGMSNWHSNPTLIECTFSRNEARTGGGMENGLSSPTMRSCMFSANEAGYGGGAMFNYRSTPTLTNCIFSGNLAGWRGGGIGNWTNNSLTVFNCTFSSNWADEGNALACWSWPQDPPSNLFLTNCILWDGGDEIWNNDNSVITITYSDVQGSWPAEGNIDDDPQFVDATSGDYHLLPCSLCIDTGDPNYIPEPNETDLDGKPRIIGGRIDMGAYEYSGLLPAEVRIVPSTINLQSKGKWITALFWLPEGYNVADIDPNSVLLENEIKAESLRVDEQQQVAIAKFSREELRGILNVGQAELTITGQLTNGTVFEGTDVIRVLNKAGLKSAN